MVKLLGARHTNMAAVGDDNQAIYRWRGAAVSNFRVFVRHFPRARVVTLTENYRSHHRILDAAYRLILNNPDRLEESDEGRRYGVTKKLAAAREPDGPEPQHLHFETATQEADAVAESIAERVADGVWRYDDVAILVRSNADADQFLRSLNLRAIPWTFSGNAGLYGRPEIRLLIAFLRAVAHPDDSVSVHYLASSDLYQVPIADLTRCSPTPTAAIGGCSMCSAPWRRSASCATRWARRGERRSGASSSISRATWSWRGRCRRASSSTSSSWTRAGSRGCRRPPRRGTRPRCRTSRSSSAACRTPRRRCATTTCASS